LVKDGTVLISAADQAITGRRRLSVAGVVSIALALDKKGELAGDPDVTSAGIPALLRDGIKSDDVIDKAIFDTIDHLPRGRRRDADAVAGAIEKAVRAALNDAWGKKPLVHVLVLETGA
jgi:ribonuclease J